MASKLPLLKPLNEMNQVCISSTIINRNIIWDYFSIKDIKELRFSYIDSTIPFWSIDEKSLILLTAELEGLIDFYLSKIKKTGKSNTLIEYKRDVYNLNFRDETEWYLGFLMDLYDMLNSTIQFSEKLYIFNRDLIKKDECDSIITYLRGSIWLNEKELFDGINLHRKQISNDLNLNIKTLQSGLKKLMSYGLVYYDKTLDSYSLTAIGYMFR
ncbi:hypothetical protein EZ428_21580 [Pedobacter frigiditerrae]|uniref:Uncharacterized protein n=1 Tax=Pedobacter frigiditerrae TaxID=2530452 RepID=A0A4V2MHP6_9SPHI|nr:hypothetical protein [Pedobacter frigiditerrae]TCC87296.1 hypothetical protein EZ428_21580 [Pedobacter frigiditerrae]